jgi:hypothetical protein
MAAPRRGTTGEPRLRRGLTDPEADKGFATDLLRLCRNSHLNLLQFGSGVTQLQCPYSNPQ